MTGKNTTHKTDLTPDTEYLTPEELRDIIKARKEIASGKTMELKTVKEIDEFVEDLEK